MIKSSRQIKSAKSEEEFEDIIIQIEDILGVNVEHGNIFNLNSEIDDDTEYKIDDICREHNCKFVPINGSRRQYRLIQSSRRIQSMKTPKNVYLNEDTQKLIQRLEKRVGHELKLKFEEGNTPYVEIEKLPKGGYSFITDKYLNNLAEHFLYDGYKEKQDSFIVYLDPAIMYTKPGIKSSHQIKSAKSSWKQFIKGLDKLEKRDKLKDMYNSAHWEFLDYIMPCDPEWTDDLADSDFNPLDEIYFLFKSPLDIEEFLFECAKENIPGAKEKLRRIRQINTCNRVVSSRQIKSALDTVKVTFDNGDTIVTDYNADVGREEIAKYYMHNYFNVGGEDEMHQVVKVEFPDNINSARTPEVADMQDAEDLALFAENDIELYNTVIKPTFDSLQRKLKRGIYDKNKALIAWEHVIDEAAKAYDRQLGSKRGTMTMFNKATRKEAAKILMDSIWDEDEWQA